MQRDDYGGAMTPNVARQSGLRWAFFDDEGRSKTGYVVFFVALGIYAAGYCFVKSSLLLDYGGVTFYCRIVMNVALFLTAAKAVLFTRYEQGEKLLMLAPVAAAVASLITSGFYDLIDLMVFVLAARGMQFEDICRKSLLIWGAVIVLIVALALLGVTSFGAEGTEGTFGLVRNSFGFKRWTDFGAALLVPYMAYFFLRYKNFKIYDYVGGVAFALVLFFVVASRASAVLVVALLLLTAFSKALRRRETLVMAVMLAIIALVMVLAFVLPLAYGAQMGMGGGLDRLNAVLSNRLHYSYGVLASSHITPFGYAFDYTNTAVGWTFLDSSYVWLFANEGVVSYACVIALYILLFGYAYRTGNTALMILVTVVMLAGFAELTLVRLGRNIVLLALLPEMEKARALREAETR